jgi:DNA replication protein DnaC
MKNDKLEKFKRRFIRELLDKSLYISAAVEIARSLTAFATNRSWLSFIEGGIGTVDVMSKFVGSWSSDLFNIQQGWDSLVCSNTQQPLHDILIPILDKFPSKIINFHYNNNQSMAKIYKLPNGKMIGKDEYGIWYYTEEGSKQELLDFLYQETYNSIHSQLFSIVERTSRGKYSWSEPGSRFLLKDEVLVSIKSPTTDKHLKHIKAAIDAGIPRSIIFLGYPGTGKSTCANTIIKELGLRTLKFKYDPQTCDLMAIETIIDALKVEAVIMDDLDTVEGSASLLGFLERMHNKVKLTIGIVNSLAPFHPAILRPARFDEIITINKLDPQVIQEILGKRFKTLYPKVKNWPVAYIKELQERININPKVNISIQIKELDKRVKNQIRNLKEPTMRE